MKRNQLRVLCAFVLCFLLNGVNGQVIFNDLITNGSGLLNTYNGWDNNSSNCAAGGFCTGSACVQLVNTPLTSPVLFYPNSTNAIQSSFGTEGPGRCITPVALATSPSVYLSVLCTIASCPDNSGSLKGDLIRLIGASNINVVGRINATATAGKVLFRVGADSNAGLISSDDATGFSIAGNTFLLILKYEAVAGGSNDVVKLFVYPTTTSPVALPTIEPMPYAKTVFSALNPEPTMIKGFHLNTFTSQTTSGMAVCKLGAFRVTTSWAAISNPQTAVEETPKTLDNLTIFPQPAADKATIEWTSTATNAATVNVSDAQGRLVWTKNAQNTEGVNRLTILTQNFANGLYFVQINNGLTTVAAKFIKQ